MELASFSPFSLSLFLIKKYNLFELYAHVMVFRRRVEANGRN